MCNLSTRALAQAGDKIKVVEHSPAILSNLFIGREPKNHRYAGNLERAKHRYDLIGSTSTALMERGHPELIFQCSGTRHGPQDDSYE